MKLSLPSGPVVATGILFALLFASDASSQTPLATQAASGVNAVIASASGKSRRLEGHNGYVGRVGVRPNQVIRITLECPGAQPGDPVAVTAADGGIITPAGVALKIGPAGTVSFNYRAESFHGLYRVVIMAGGAEQLLEFYVLDVEHPGNNPPRVKIVD